MIIHAFFKCLLSWSEVRLIQTLYCYSEITVLMQYLLCLMHKTKNIDILLNLPGMVIVDGCRSHKKNHISGTVPYEFNRYWDKFRTVSTSSCMSIAWEDSSNHSTLCSQATFLTNFQPDLLPIWLGDAWVSCTVFTLYLQYLRKQDLLSGNTGVSFLDPPKGNVTVDRTALCLNCPVRDVSF